MKKFLSTLCLMSGLCAATIATAADLLPIDSFNTPDNKTELGGWWYVFNDARVGGNSVVKPLPDHFVPENSGAPQEYAAHMAGTAGNKLGWDFFGMGFTITSDSGCPGCTPIDLSQYGTLEFKIKGKATAGRLSVVIPYTGGTCENNVPETLTAWADYQAGLTASLKDTWTTIKLDLRKDFTQPAWTKPEHKVSIDQVLRNVHVIQWQFSSADGDSVDVWLDDIALY